MYNLSEVPGMLAVPNSNWLSSYITLRAEVSSIFLDKSGYSYIRLSLFDFVFALFFTSRLISTVFDDKFFNKNI